ncbi:hypothetical protein DUNSADRAFT_14188, partial [Dunaliella salina]
LRLYSRHKHSNPSALHQPSQLSVTVSMGNCQSEMQAEQTASPAPQNKEQQESGERGNEQPQSTERSQDQEPSLGEQVAQGVQQEVTGEVERAKEGAKHELTSEYQELKNDAHETAREEQAELQDQAKESIGNALGL